MRPVHFLAVTFLFIGGCDIFNEPEKRQEPDDAGGTGTPRQVGLKRFESENEFQEYFAAQVTGFTDFSGGGRGGEVLEDGDAAAPPVAPTADAGAGGDGGAQGVAADESTASSGNYSTTTQQEEGVQEGDIIKNDGTYLYVLSNSSLRIVQANPGESLRELSNVTLDGYGLELYLAGDQVVAITQPDAYFAVPVRVAADDALIAPEPYYYRPQVEATVINVADRSQPTVQSTSTFDGNLHSSRMIDATLHLVLVNYPDFFMPLIEFRNDSAVLIDAAPTDILPDFEIQVGASEPVSGELVQATDVYRPIDPDGYGMTTVLSMDINNPTGFRAAGVVAYPGNIYASTEALYLTNSEYDFTTGSDETTAVSKFAFTDAGPVLVAVGSVPGHVLNQYSMSEFNGFLRVATTVQNFDFTAETVPPPTNNVYVLGEQGEELAVVGKVENLAPGETIYSARFYGDKGYLVTFEQVDPLFTLDLADPANPKAVGELKVPGFSTFIVQIDATHLLTIGQDVNLDQGFAIPQGVQLSIFDLTDFANPRLVATEKVTDAGAWSEALYNPKALTLLPSQNLAALPVQIYNYGIIEDVALPTDVDVSDGGGTDGSEGGAGESEEPASDFAPVPVDSFNGIYVYQFNVNTGFQFLGRMSTVLDAQAYYYSSFTRGVFIGDNVYGVSDLGVVAAPKAAIAEAAPWRVTFPIEAIPTPDVMPVDGGPIVIDDGGIVDGDPVVIEGGGGTADGGSIAGVK